MPDSDKFVKGRCYFMLSFYDEDLEIPLVETYIFAGKNMIKKSRVSEDLWYFKEPDAFIENGAAMTEKDFENCICLDEEHLELVHDLPMLIGKLKEIRDRLR